MSLRSKPHYTLSAPALADWIESHPDKWWAVDGDPYLTSVVDFPCPSDELGPAIRGKGNDLLVYDKTPSSETRGERIEKDRLSDLADTSNRKHQMVFLLSWSDSDEEWLLREDEALVAG